MAANNDSEARRPVPENEYSIFEHHEVIIIGAGPTGLFTALRIAQADVDVCVMEAEPGIVNSPRATTYMPIVCNEFEKAGIYEDVLARGHKNTEGISFRTSFAKGDKVLARLRMSQVPKGQHKYELCGHPYGPARACKDHLGTLQ
jgi:2-polyprenyl-6-methoxyphenol hydroxylase-like FAD-dependent oxidoreductase